MEKAKKTYSPLNFSIKRCYEPSWAEFTGIHIQNLPEQRAGRESDCRLLDNCCAGSPKLINMYCTALWPGISHCLFVIIIIKMGAQQSISLLTTLQIGDQLQVCLQLMYTHHNLSGDQRSRCEIRFHLHAIDVTYSYSKHTPGIHRVRQQQHNSTNQ